MMLVLCLALASLSLRQATALPQPKADPAPRAEPRPASPLAPGAVLYHTLWGRDAQVVFTSDAPLEKIIGKSNAVRGFAVPGPPDNPAKLVNAAWELPVVSLVTGIPLRDEHLAAKDWLDSESFPVVSFVLSRVDDIKEIKRGEEFSTWSGALVGNLTLHGVTHEIVVKDARFSFFAESPKTAAIAPGNLMFLKCEYTVSLTDFGVRNPDVPKKVSDRVTLSQMLRLSSVQPEAIEQPPLAKSESPDPVARSRSVPMKADSPE